MSAQPIEEYELDPHDPLETLRIMPKKHHDFFLAEYTKAWEQAWHPEGYRKFRKFLRLWRRRAIMYSDPSYEDDRAAAREGRGEWIPAEQLFPDWPLK